jgi:histidine triad (HIT) family protein
MASVFSMIIAGDLPGRFVYTDDVCVAFLSINPLSLGHTLVVPREEVDHWLDLEDDTIAHIHIVGARIGRAIQQAFSPVRVGTAIAGFEVPHTHLHVFAADSMAAFDWAAAEGAPDARVLDGAAEAIRAALHDLGHGDHVPA